MIVALLEIIGGTVVNVFGALLGALTVAIPDSIYSAITWVFAQVFYFQGWFPVATMLSALSFYLLIWIIMYSVKLIIMIINMIPGVNIQLPWHHREIDPIDAYLNSDEAPPGRQ
jgi:hypothetical protein